MHFGVFYFSVFDPTPINTIDRLTLYCIMVDNLGGKFLRFITGVG